MENSVLLKENEIVEATIDGKEWLFLDYGHVYENRIFCWITKTQGNPRMLVEVKSIRPARRILSRQQAEKEFNIKIVG
jgi:hypothetical protein